QEVKCTDCLSMKIIDDQMPIGARGNWNGPWPEALLRPNLVWNIKCTESIESLTKTIMEPLIEKQEQIP
ncbi:TPA: ABC transporter ATP-binding protein, partial [Legionella pneumophila subsp. pneumophila]|nr:ABC transporter ATP-binding protein [Legionella pneumophila subsp. pneumophila]